MPPPRVPTNCSPSGRTSMSSSKVGAAALARSRLRVKATINAAADQVSYPVGVGDILLALAEGQVVAAVCCDLLVADVAVAHMGNSVTPSVEIGRASLLAR